MNVQTLREKYESQLQTRSFSSRLLSLLSDAPDRTTARPSAEAPNRNCGSSEEPTGRGPWTEPAGDETKEENICTGRSAECECFTLRAAVTELPAVSGCGVIIEVLPYLEVSCVSDETSKSVATEVDSRSATCLQDHENQSSLITLAWGKPCEDPGDQGAEVAAIAHDTLEMTFQSSDGSSGGEQGQFEDRADAEPTLVQSGSAGHPGRLRVDEQRRTFPQVTSADVWNHDSV